MITCKNVARVLASDEFRELDLWHRAEIRLHLFMCRNCSRFARQLEQIRAAMRKTPLTEDPELEDRIISRLSGRK